MADIFQNWNQLHELTVVYINFTLPAIAKLINYHVYSLFMPPTLIIGQHFFTYFRLFSGKAKMADICENQELTFSQHFLHDLIEVYNLLLPAID